MKLQKVLSEKKETQRLYTIESGATLRTAAKKMISLKTDYLMVKAKDHTPAEFIGILTKVDIVRSLCMEESNPDTNTVDDFMTHRMIVANVNDDVEYLMNVMVRHNISHLPVIEGKNIAGVISRNDILAQRRTRYRTAMACGLLRSFSETHRLLIHKGGGILWTNFWRLQLFSAGFHAGCSSGAESSCS